MDIYFQKDVSRILAGQVVIAVETYLANGAANGEHIRGVMTLAKGIAAAIGVAWPAVVAEVRADLGPLAVGLLDVQTQIAGGLDLVGR